MDSINDLLNSISPDDIQKIKTAAQGLMAAPPSESISSNPTATSMFSDEMSNMLLKVASQMNKDSDKTAFIKALRPLLSDERQKKADEAMHFLKLMDTLPLLRGMFK